MKNTLKLISFFIILKLALSIIAPICTNDKTCNTLRTTETLRCSEKSCVKYGEAAYKATPSSTEQCTKSFRRNNKCSSFAALNCPIPAAETSYRSCIQGTLKDGKCTAATASTDTYSKKDARCDSTTSPRELCPSGMKCLNKVCREQLGLGQACTGSDIGCITGSQCDFGKCELLFSKVDGQYCQSSSVCASQSCQGSICVPRIPTKCYDNNDCDSANSFTYCKKPSATSTTDEPGTCFSPYTVALTDFVSCQYHKCMSPANGFNAGNAIEGCKKACMAQQVKSMCSRYCGKKPEDRFDSGEPYTVDCAAMTITDLVAGTDCEILEQFKNCDAMFTYSAAVDSNSASIAFIILVVVFLFFAL